MHTTEIRKKKGISPIWILPVVALLIGGWLLYKGINEKGVEVVVHFKSAEGITPGKTKVVYKGIPVGIVREVRVDPGMDSVSILIEMDRRTEEKLVEDVKFWIVRPKISGGKVSGLNTLFSGSYIAVQPGRSKKQAREFVGLENPPPVPPDAPGLHIVLKADALGSIRRETGIFYRNIQIGSVQDYELKDGEGVIIRAYIEPKYASLIKKHTRFYDTSGITVKGNLSGLKVHMESVSTLLYGGIGLYTPESHSRAPEQAQNGDVFKLYEDRDAAEAWDTIKIHMPSAMGLTVGGSKLIYRGVEIGVVSRMVFNQDKAHTVTAYVQVEPEASFILRKNTKFWVVKPQVSINRIANLETVIKGAYLSCEPGDGEFAEEFVLSEQPERIEVLRPGRRFILYTENGDSLSLGAPVFYKKIKVGEVVGFDLSENGQGVEAEIFINRKYQHLVGRNTVFWKYGGVTVDAGWGGIKFKIGNLASILGGGIAFTNPSGAPDREAEEYAKFTLYDSYGKASKAVPAMRSRGLMVELRTPALKNFSVGSPITYKNIRVGEITGFSLDVDNDSILAEAIIYDDYSGLIRPNTVFWKNAGITVNAGLDGVKIETGSLRSILEGEITFTTPDDGNAGEADLPYPPFQLYENFKEAQAAVPSLRPSGLHVTVVASGSEGFSIGSPVLYKRIPVGSITDLNLTPGGDDIELKVFIKERYSHLLRKTSRFYNLSGISVEAGLGGIRMNTGTLKSVVSGGIAFFTPAEGPKADEDSRFRLYADFDSAKEADAVAHGLKIVLKTPNLGSLKKGTPILYRQVVVGKVTGYRLSPDAREVLVDVTIFDPYDALVYENTKFWNASGIRVKAGLFSGVKVDTETVESIITGGIAMATPEDSLERGAKAKDGTEFILEPKGKERWRRWSPAINISGAGGTGLAR